ncbi:MAG TPA: polysaccharide biosynthesis/export family protein [Bryobacteraceae bacterium]|nr:polysaccharide biosynthesis/export family protein [Bryobacteraceae bacterium]
MKSPSLYLALPAAIAVFAGCLAAAQTVPDVGARTAKEQSQPAQTPAGATDNAAKGPALPVAVDPHKYLIGAEDVLHVLVWREADLTGDKVVRPDGKISLPLIGELQAAGLTPEQLGNDIGTALGKYINSPEVTVSLMSVNSKKYYIDGEVNKPGEYKLVTPTTVLEALSQAGGFREFAKESKIRILRGSTTLHFNYKQVSHAKKMEQNIYLENGDHIIVP